MSCWAEKSNAVILQVCLVSTPLSGGFLEEETSKIGQKNSWVEAETSLVTVLREGITRSYTQILGLVGVIHYGCVPEKLTRAELHLLPTSQSSWDGNYSQADPVYVHSHNSLATHLDFSLGTGKAWKFYKWKWHSRFILKCSLQLKGEKWNRQSSRWKQEECVSKQCMQQEQAQKHIPEPPIWTYWSKRPQVCRGVQYWEFSL